MLIARFVADSKLCVATVLDEYIDRISSLLGEEQQLFISYAKPHHGVCRDTILRWIRTGMQKVGVDTTVFKPHSTRVASTSKARTCNVQLPAVMKAASWSSDCVSTLFTTTQFSPKIYRTVLVMLFFCCYGNTLIINLIVRPFFVL